MGGCGMKREGKGKGDEQVGGREAYRRKDVARP